MKNLFVVALFLISFISQGQRTQVGQDIDGEALGDMSGYTAGVSLSSDGSVVAIGATLNSGNGAVSGHVRVFENISGTWTQVGQDIDGEAAGDRSGRSVSLSSDGSVVAIGAYKNRYHRGHVRVYRNISGTWTQVGQDIDGEANIDESGTSVSLSSDGSVVAIGSEINSGNGYAAGHVRIYRNISGTWRQVGQDIDGEAFQNRSGSSVSLSSDGSVVAIGARDNHGNGIRAGHVRVYQNISGTWTQVGQDIDGEGIQDISGHSVSLSSDGTIVAIGAPNNEENEIRAGHVRIYQNISGTWTQVGQDIDGEAAGDSFGRSVSLSSDGSVVAIGATYNDNKNGNNAGHVQAYQNISGTWTQVGKDIYGEAADDYSGFSVSLSSNGSVVAIGAPFNDGNGFRSGQVRVFNTTLNSNVMVEICHIRPGNPNNPQTIYVPQNAVPAHLAHGDYLGPCAGRDNITGIEDLAADIQATVSPNPFTDHATFTFTLTETNNTTLKVYNTFGKEVATLFDGMAESGQQYSLNFSSGNLPKGIYLYHIQSGNKVSVIKKMILIR